MNVVRQRDILVDTPTLQMMIPSLLYPHYILGASEHDLWLKVGSFIAEFVTSRAEDGAGHCKDTLAGSWVSEMNI